MGKLSKYLYGIMAAAMLAGCSDDGISPDDPGTLGPDDGSGFFMALDIQMPGGGIGSRSETNTPEPSDTTTSTGGIEFGQDYENNVTSALIVLAAKDAVEGKYEKYGFIAAGTVLNNRISNITSVDASCKHYKATARLQKSNLENFYTAVGNTTEETGSHEVYVFVFCNPTAELTAIFDQTQPLSNGETLAIGSAAWLDETCSVIQGNPEAPNKNIGIWGSNSFLMNNVVLATRKLPGQLLTWEKYNSVDTPFHLSEGNDEGVISNADTDGTNGVAGGAVRVERSVARFDFRDGSGSNNTYSVLKSGEGNDAPTIVEVQLQKMCLVNMSNQFYYLPRVSEYGFPESNKFAYCGAERPWTREGGIYTGGNYVVGPYCDDFNIKDLNVASYKSSKYFNFPFFSDNSNDELVSFENGAWDVVEIEDVLQGTPDKYSGINATEADKHFKPGDFKIWRYVTENVIPWPTSNQRNANSTGVVFKARIKGVSPTGVQDEYWSPGAIANIANCLNGQTFTYEGNDEAKLTGDSNTDPILYYFDGHLYMGWRHIRQAAIQASVTINTSGDIEINRSNSLYQAVFGANSAIPHTYTYWDTKNNKFVTAASVYIKAGENNTLEEVEINDPEWLDWNINWEKPAENAQVSQDAEYQNYLNSADYAWLIWDNGHKPATGELLAAMRSAITSAGITIYQTSTDDSKQFGSKVPGYYCYYYYWNRHNDNNIAGTMGPMEFAVVRNNVYKLTVDKISRLGHPRIPDNDPDNPTPDTPDESDKIYLDVQVHIIPWAVRVNNIVF